MASSIFPKGYFPSERNLIKNYRGLGKLSNARAFVEMKKEIYLDAAVEHVNNVFNCYIPAGRTVEDRDLLVRFIELCRNKSLTVSRIHRSAIEIVCCNRFREMILHTMKRYTMTVEAPMYIRLCNIY